MIQTRKASFNGIDFYIVASSVVGGHKQSVHEFNNNLTTVQQHGAMHKTYALSAIFVGMNSLALKPTI